MSYKPARRTIVTTQRKRREYWWRAAMANGTYYLCTTSKEALRLGGRLQFFWNGKWSNVYGMESR